MRGWGRITTSAAIQLERFSEAEQVFDRRSAAKHYRSFAAEHGTVNGVIGRRLLSRANELGKDSVWIGVQWEI